MKRLLSLLLPLALLTVGCGGDDDGGGLIPTGPVMPTTESFDRGALLGHYANSVIVPAWEDYLTEAQRLSELAATLPAERTDLRAQFQRTYLSWQRLFPVLTGPGAGGDLVSQLNFYPYGEEDYQAAVAAGQPVGASDNRIAVLPTLEYALYALTDEAYAATEAQNLVAEAAGLSYQEAFDVYERNWQTEAFRSRFIQNTASSSTGSIDQLVNDWLFSYERFLRAGKVGIPAGVFSGEALPGHAEAIFNEGVSRAYLLESLGAMQGFFDGGDETTHDLADYLDALEVERDGRLLSALIREQFANVIAQVETLDADLETQVRQDNAEMLRTFDEMQRLLVLLKIDLLQALSINVDYVDADGD